MLLQIAFLWQTSKDKNSLQIAFRQQTELPPPTFKEF